MKKGFTLVELLIVVIIIGVLASLAIPQYLKAVERGRVSKAKNMITLIAQAEKMYQADHQVFIDTAGLTPIAPVAGDDANDLIDYVDGIVAADLDWTYTVLPGYFAQGIDDSFVAGATRNANAAAIYENDTIGMNMNSICSGDMGNGGVPKPHNLRGQDCTVLVAIALDEQASRDSVPADIVSD